VHAWDKYLTERDRLVFEQAGYGRRCGFGAHPALLIIDVTYSFVGAVPEPLLESIKKWRNSCGEEGWAAVRQIQPILQAARASHVPVIYTFEEARPDFVDIGVHLGKNRRSKESTSVQGHKGTQIVAELAPAPDDLWLSKKRASAFFGTPLISYLVGLGVDTLIVTGCTTSGCVRATVVDGQSYNLRMIVVEDGVFDRGEVSHAISLWDMQAKYADVVPAQEVIEYLKNCAVTAAC
jgi:nicotinamidase-related amidase